MRRLDEALGSLRLSIDDMLSRRDVAFEGEHRDVLEAYRMFANDRGWVRRLEEAIRNGLTAEAAVEKVQSDMRARMLRLTDPYLRERHARFRRSRQPAAAAADGPRRRTTSPPTLPKDAIIVARAMGAAELPRLPARQACAAWCWRRARSPATSSSWRAPWAFPSSGRSSGAVSLVENGDAIIVDGDDGRGASAAACRV